MRVRYTGPYSAVDVPALGVTVAQGDTIDVPDDWILGDHWTVDRVKNLNVAELRARLDDAGIDYPKTAKRADLLDLLTNSTTSED